MAWVSAFVVFAASEVAMAGQYMMINDSIDMPQPDGVGIVEKHAEVCTAFMKVLEASPPFPPMACDVKFPPGFPDFKVPEWQSVDVWENKDLELQVGPKGNEQDEARRLANIKDYVTAGLLSHRTAQLDIDNDGTPDHILARIHGKCVPEKKRESAPYWRGYKVYSVPVRKLDVEKSQFYGSYWEISSLFSYKGVTYYASLLGDTTRQPYFDKLELPDEKGFLPTKYYIKIFRPLPMHQGMRTTWKQPVALGCEYLYLPTNHEGGY
jgi:hypothetical protein